MVESSTQHRLFTLEEANAMLPLVRVIIRDIMTLSNSVLRTRERLESVRQRSKDHVLVGRGLESYREEIADMEAVLSDDVDKLHDCLRELKQLAVEPKGLTEGLVDFPSLRDGELVNLCWKYGEERIAYWHSYDSGFAGRKPIADDDFFHDSQRS